MLVVYNEENTRNDRVISLQSCRLGEGVELVVGERVGSEERTPLQGGGVGGIGGHGWASPRTWSGRPSGSPG